MPARTWTVYVDSASRGDPGPAAIGAAILGPSGREVYTISRRIGAATAIEAEQRAAIAGLEASLALEARIVDLRVDSDLLVRQMQHRVRVDDPRLRPLLARLVDLRRRFDSFSVKAVSRDENARADALAGAALARLDG